MDLIDHLRKLSSRIPSQLDHLTTEEATKNALVMPFITALGYDVFDPTEVVPEYTADVGTKRGEKVDYAIMRNGEPIMLFECKSARSNLDEEHVSQLFRYFSVTTARLGILTNGVHYKFFSDLEEPNKMDARAFFEFDLHAVNDQLAGNLKRFAKEAFDLEEILTAASDLKYTNGIQRLMNEEWVNPSEEFMRVFAERVYAGRMTQQVKDQFTAIVKRAFHEFVNTRINDRLKSALERTSPAAGEDCGANGAPGDGVGGEKDAGEIVTTADELEGYYIVKAILGDTVEVQRVFMRDTLSYCGILLDDNNRLPICRLRFNSLQKYLGLFDDKKVETKHTIDDPNDIYKYADQLRQTARHHVHDILGTA